MMTYRRFVIDQDLPAATPATLATLRTVSLARVADVASVAAGHVETTCPLAAALADLLAANPTDDERRWLRACDDAALFLREWDQVAHAHGWTVHDLFSLHPIAPLARYDAMGLLWLLDGRKVLKLTPTEARLSNGLAVRRRQANPPLEQDQALDPAMASQKTGCANARP